MGHIKEPEGVDFYIKSKPLTDADRKKISEYIAVYKVERTKKVMERSKKTPVKSK